MLNQLSYFPGCSLETTAKEGDNSLRLIFEQCDVKINELKDWNCCGSASAHAIDHELSTSLPSRNLSLAPRGVPVLVPCPNCYLRLKLSHMELVKNESARQQYERLWNRDFDPDLKIVTFLETIQAMSEEGAFEKFKDGLKGLKVACYYGCMLARPPVMRKQKTLHGYMEEILTSLGAEALQWNSATKCCGTFLTVTQTEVANQTIRTVLSDAEDAEAQCIVTPCAMCQMNLEMRTHLGDKMPILHLSEVLPLAMGIGGGRGWFRRHLIDPRPLLKSKSLIN